MINYFLYYWQPLTVLLIGVLCIFFFIYLHVYQKKRIVHWMAKYIFRNEHMIPSATDAFNVVTSFIVTIGGLWVILSLFYLVN